MRAVMAWVVALTVVPTSALADDKAACLNAATKGQRFRDTHKLVEAREQLRVCAAAACPSIVQSDCAGWLADVENALPTLVVSAKSSTGVDLVDVRVSVDGQPLLSKLDGQAVSMDPGVHAFHFEAHDGTSLDSQVLVKEGDKNRPVAVVIPAATPPPTKQPAHEALVATSSGPSSWKPIGWAMAGVGAAGLAMASVLGIVAVADKNAHCDANDLCDPGASGRIKSEALLSDVGWIAGGVVLAGGIATLLLAPKRAREKAARIEVAPIVGAGGGGVAVEGTF